MYFITQNLMHLEINYNKILICFKIHIFINCRDTGPNDKVFEIANYFDKCTSFC